MGITDSNKNLYKRYCRDLFRKFWNMFKIKKSVKKSSMINQIKTFAVIIDHIKKKIIKKNN